MQMTNGQLNRGTAALSLVSIGTLFPAHALAFMAGAFDGVIVLLASVVCIAFLLLAMFTRSFVPDLRVVANLIAPLGKYFCAKS